MKGASRPDCCVWRKNWTGFSDREEVVVSGENALVIWRQSNRYGHKATVNGSTVVLESTQRENRHGNSTLIHTRLLLHVGRLQVVSGWNGSELLPHVSPDWFLISIQRFQLANRWAKYSAESTITISSFVCSWRVSTQELGNIIR